MTNSRRQETKYQASAKRPSTNLGSKQGDHASAYKLITILGESLANHANPKIAIRNLFMTIDSITRIEKHSIESMERQVIELSGKFYQEYRIHRSGFKAKKEEDKNTQAIPKSILKSKQSKAQKPGKKLKKILKERQRRVDEIDELLKAYENKEEKLRGELEKISNLAKNAHTAIDYVLKDPEFINQHPEFAKEKRGEETKGQVDQGVQAQKDKKYKDLIKEFLAKFVELRNKLPDTAFAKNKRLPSLNNEGNIIKDSANELAKIDFDRTRHIYKASVQEVAQLILNLFWYPPVPDQAKTWIQDLEDIEKVERQKGSRINNLDKLCVVISNHLDLILSCYRAIGLNSKFGQEVRNQFIYFVTGNGTIKDTIDGSIRDVEIGWNLDLSDINKVIEEVTSRLFGIGREELITSEEETSTEEELILSSIEEYVTDSSEDENQETSEEHSEKDEQEEEPIVNNTLQQQATESALLRNDSTSSSDSLSSTSYIKPDNEKNQVFQNVKQPGAEASPSELALFNYYIKKAQESLASYYNSNPIIRESLGPLKSSLDGLDSLKSNLQRLLTQKRPLDNAEEGAIFHTEKRSKKNITSSPSTFSIDSDNTNAPASSTAQPAILDPQRSIIIRRPSSLDYLPGNTSSTASPSSSNPIKKSTSEEEQLQGISEKQTQGTSKFGHHK